MSFTNKDGFGQQGRDGLSTHHDSREPNGSRRSQISDYWRRVRERLSAIDARKSQAQSSRVRHAPRGGNSPKG